MKMMIRVIPNLTDQKILINGVSLNRVHPLDRIQRYRTNFLTSKSSEYLPKNLRRHFRYKKFAAHN